MESPLHQHAGRLPAPLLLRHFSFYTRSISTALWPAENLENAPSTENRYQIPDRPYSKPHMPGSFSMHNRLWSSRQGDLATLLAEFLTILC